MTTKEYTAAEIRKESINLSDYPGYQMVADMLTQAARNLEELEACRKDAVRVDDTVIVSAFRYCLGRQSYIVGSFCEWLVTNWPKIDERSRLLIQRELDQAFADEDSGKFTYKLLGDACDRQEWGKVRALYASKQP